MHTTGKPMVAEEVASSHLPGLEVQLALSLEIPGEAGVNVAIDLPYECSMSYEAQDTLNQYLYNGVHGGLASVDLPLPDEGVLVILTTLGLTPPPKESASEQELRRIGRLLQTLVRYSVATLWEGLESQRSTELPEAR
jgi:hypothetical protein